MTNSTDDEIRAYYKLTKDPILLKMYDWLRIEVEGVRGLGDTIAKITHTTGLDKLAKLYTQVTGKPCGCQSRQEALNKLIPYGVSEDA